MSPVDPGHYDREIWYQCRQYNAAEALQMGLVNAVVPVDRLEDETGIWARGALRWLEAIAAEGRRRPIRLPARRNSVRRRGRRPSRPRPSVPPPGPPVLARSRRR